ncbi:MAG: hypothetical protein J6Z49_08940 [Kiritimatiellae bacterium]|nr:hypothetical protein [Kiritimatiellia bacterium]
MGNLASLWQKPTSSLVVCREHHRIGKSTQIPGFVFKNLTVNNWPEILFWTDTVETAAPCRHTSSDRRKGAQINLLAQTPRTVYVEEITRKKVIEMDEVDEVDEKVRCLKLRRGINECSALIYDGELVPRLADCGCFAATLDAATHITGRRG